jgi:hypothetical protein
MDKRQKEILLAIGYAVAAIGMGITLYMSWANQNR